MVGAMLLVDEGMLLMCRQGVLSMRYSMVSPRSTSLVEVAWSSSACGSAEMLAMRDVSSLSAAEHRRLSAMCSLFGALVYEAR